MINYYEESDLMNFGTIQLQELGIVYKGFATARLLHRGLMMYDTVDPMTDYLKVPDMKILKN